MTIFKMNKAEAKGIGNFLPQTKSEFGQTPSQHMYVFEGKKKQKDYSSIVSRATQLIATANDKRSLNPAKELSADKMMAIKEFLEVFKERRSELIID